MRSSSDSGQLRPAVWKRLIVARTVDAATPIRRAISRIGTPPTNFNRRTSRTWRMIVLSAGIRSLLWNSQRRGPEAVSRGTCHPGRDHPGMVGDIISERWAELSRNGWAASFRNHGRLLRNPHTSPATPPPEQHPQIASGHLWALSGPPCGARVSRALVRSRRASWAKRASPSSR
jgi:hypothetical protein